MNGSVRQAEILAPAGNMTALKAAVHNGADAVYLGLGAFNARAKAENFTIETLQNALDFAHLHGVKVYIAFNTLLKDAEMPVATQLALQAEDMGADAFILQDFGFLRELRRLGVRVEFHASTQAGIHNVEGAIFAKRLGFSRVILSRETTLADIKRIRAATDLELECFVHGALCVSFSGNCYFSSLLTGESGNRGRCLQFCRKPYKLINESDKTLCDGYLLSPKDLNLSQDLGELWGAGVSSFKIEGRLRRPEYTGEVVRVYKKALCGTLSANDADSLNVMFNRGGSCRGYLYDPTANVIAHKHPAHIGALVGYVAHVGRTVAITYMVGAPKLEKGDGIKFMRDGTEVGHALVSNPEVLTFRGKLKAGNEVRITSRERLNKEVLSRRRTIPLQLTADIQTGQCVTLSIADNNGCIASVMGEHPVVQSKTAPLTEGNLQFLSKTNDESLVMSDITLNLGDNCFVSVAELKHLKRAALSAWRQSKLNRYREQQRFPAYPVDNAFKELHFLDLSDKNTIFVAVAHADAVTDELCKRCDYLVLNPTEYTLLNAKRFCERAKGKAILNLPVLARCDDMDVLRQIVKKSGIEIFIVNNPYGFELCREKTLIAGIGMNALNCCAGDMTRIASVEAERADKGAINYIYGAVPLMTLSHCPKKNLCGARCKQCGGLERLALSDEHGACFYYRRKKITHCYYELLNGIPLDNRELLTCGNYNVMIDLSVEANPTHKLREFMSIPHSSVPHMHGNYKKELK